MCYLLTFLLDELKSRAPENKKIASEDNFKTREYALIGRSEGITQLRQKIVEHKDAPTHLIIKGEKGVGKRLFSDIVRTEGVLDKCQLCYLNINQENDYKVFASFLEKVHKLQNMLFVIKGFEKIGKQDFELLKKYLHSNIAKGQKVVFHLLYTPPMDHQIDLKDLAEFMVEVPPLKKRRTDFYQIFSHFLDKECRFRGIPQKNLSKGVVDELSQNHWPGNVEELKRIVARIADLYPYHHYIYELPNNDIFPIIKEKFDEKLYSKIVIRDLLTVMPKENVSDLMKSKFVVDRYHHFHNDKEQTAATLGISEKDVDFHIDRFKDLWNKVS